MPLVLLLLGIGLLVVAIKGTQSTVLGLLTSEFTGSGSFVPWVAAILILASVGYIKPVRPLADAFVGLIIFAMIVSNRGVFAAFNQQIRNPVAPAAPAASATPLTAPGGNQQPGSILPGIVNPSVPAGANATPGISY